MKTIHYLTATWIFRDRRSRLYGWVVGAIATALSGCWPPAELEVVVYTALDREFSEPILNDFAERTGITVRPVYDLESTKTVGLYQRIVREADRPRCDLFWNNEILNTLRLQRAGLLEVYRSPAAAPYPAAYRSPDGYWHGFAGRLRVLIVNTKLVGRDEMPDSVFDLAEPKWQGRVGIAKPLFGTTATHAACLFAKLGEDRAGDFFTRLQANQVRILSGNKDVARRVAAGEIAFGLTDTDDALGEIEAGFPVRIVYPDQQPDQMGVLLIPNTLAIVKGAPNADHARRLVDELLSAGVESRLAESPSGQIPLNPQVKTRPRGSLATPDRLKLMEIDFAAAAAQHWETAARFLNQYAD